MVDRVGIMSNFVLHKTQSGHHHCIPWILLPQKHIRHDPVLFYKAQFAKIQKKQGAECKMHHHQFGTMPNGKTNITMLLLGENYPKIIYGMLWLRQKSSKVQIQI